MSEPIPQKVEAAIETYQPVIAGRIVTVANVGRHRLQIRVQGVPGFVELELSPAGSPRAPAVLRVRQDVLADEPCFEYVLAPPAMDGAWAPHEIVPTLCPPSEPSSG